MTDVPIYAEVHEVQQEKGEGAPNQNRASDNIIVSVGFRIYQWLG